jgi:CMP/dCMP kinase
LSPAERELILRDIIDRDQRDSSRADGPLTRPADAIFVDTSALGLPQVVDRLEREARARITTFG